MGNKELRIVYVEFEGLICFPMKIFNIQLEKDVNSGEENCAECFDL